MLWWSVVVCGQLRVISSSLFKMKLDTPFSFVKKPSVWEGSEHVYPVGSEPGQCRLLLGPCPSYFPSSCALRWADRWKSCQSGCQSFKGPHREGTQRLVCSALRWGRCQQLPGRELGVCLHLTSPSPPAGWCWSLFNPCVFTKVRMTAVRSAFALHLPPFLKGQIRSFLLLELIEWQVNQKDSFVIKILICWTVDLRGKRSK